MSLLLAGCSNSVQSSSSPTNALPALGAPPAVACTAPKQVIRDGVNKPRSIAFDTDGDLVVANANANNVTVYPAGKDAPAQTIESGVNHPTALAFDAKGDLFVGNRATGSVTVYGPGKFKLKREIIDGTDSPEALVFDSAGNLYVVNNLSSTISVFARGQDKPERTISGLNDPFATTFDSEEICTSQIRASIKLR